MPAVIYNQFKDEEVRHKVAAAKLADLIFEHVLRAHITRLEPGTAITHKAPPLITNLSPIATHLPPRS